MLVQSPAFNQTETQILNLALQFVIFRLDPLHFLINLSQFLFYSDRVSERQSTYHDIPAFIDFTPSKTLSIVFAELVGVK